MDKKEKNSVELNSEQESFEMIELAVEDIEALARAFRMIDDMCQELNPEREEIPDNILWN